MDQPSWTDIKTANLAYPAMVAAWVAAIATVLAAGFAAFAAVWAKRAVDAAQAQIRLLEKQISLSDPQPVVMLNVRYEGNAAIPFIEFENVGEELAFDVELSELTAFNSDGKYTTRFVKEPVIKIGQKKDAIFSYSDGQKNRNGRLGKSLRDVGLTDLFNDLQSEYIAKKDEPIPDKDGRFALRPVTLRYKNARGFRFETRFILGMRDLQMLEFFPEWSLVESRQKEQTKA